MINKNYIDCELMELYHLLGKRWTIPLLHNIGDTPITYNELFSLSKRLINPTLLSKRLKDLIRFRIIKKQIIDAKTTYSITEEGKALKDILHGIKRWSIDCGYNLPEYCKTGKCLCDEIFNKKVSDYHH